MVLCSLVSRQDRSFVVHLLEPPINLFNLRTISLKKITLLDVDLTFTAGIFEIYPGSDFMIV